MPPSKVDPETVRAKVNELLSSHEDDIRQIEAALLLHNPVLFGVIDGIVVAFFLSSILLTRCLISPVVYAFILIPLYHLLSLTGAGGFVRKFYLSELPALNDDDPSRVRSLADVIDLLLPGLTLFYSGLDFAVATLKSPIPADTLILLVVVLSLALIGQIVNLFVVLLIFSVLALLTPIILTKTPAGAQLRAKSSPPPGD
jgi:hypothetical protein